MKIGITKKHIALAIMCVFASVIVGAIFYGIGAIYRHGARNGLDLLPVTGIILGVIWGAIIVGLIVQWADDQ